VLHMFLDKLQLTALLSGSGWSLSSTYFFVKAGPKHLKGALGQRESGKTVLFPLDKVSTRVEFYSIEVVPTYR
jgi:hypothetical protein